MRKITFEIDDINWFKKFFKASEKDLFEKLYQNAKPFKVTYSLMGDKSPDRYELYDDLGIKMNVNDLNGYQRGTILNQCYDYFVGRQINISDMCGVINITEIEF